MPRFYLFGIILLAAGVFVTDGRGQSIYTAISSAHDPNIFENYTSTSDQVTSWTIGSGKDFDFPMWGGGVSYEGALQMYRDLPGRTYYAHTLEFSPYFTMISHDDDEEEEVPDTVDIDEDSTGAPVYKIVYPSKTFIPPDSLDHLLNGSVSYSSEFDKIDFQAYDNSRVGAWAAYKFPLSPYVSLRPGAAADYHKYPNLDLLSNTETNASVSIGIWGRAISWLEAGVTFGNKNYLTSATLYDTIKLGNSGHGKGGGGGGIRIHSFQYSNPSVGQVIWTAASRDTIVPGTIGQIRFTHWGNPNQEARLIPHTAGNAGGPQNDVFDDHYAFTGNGYSASISQTLPMNFSLDVGIDHQDKSYTSPALDLNDSTVSDQRLDHRTSLSLSFGKSIPLGPRGTLRPMLSFAYLRNSSNSVYNDFDKSVVSLGIVFSY